MMDDKMLPDDDTPHVDPPAALRALDHVVAPDRLRLAVAAQAATAQRAQTRERRVWGRFGGMLAAAGAAAVVLVVLGLFAGRILDENGSSAPGVQAVVPVALRAPAEPAPAVSADGEWLAEHAGPIAYPSWRHAGWHAVGARRDTIDGHEVRTVVYADDAGRRVGYAIAEGRLASSGGEFVMRRGTRLRVLQQGETAIVTWRRDGRTCVIAGRGVEAKQLVLLAGYAV